MAEVEKFENLQHLVNNFPIIECNMFQTKLVSLNMVHNSFSKSVLTKSLVK